MSPKKCSFLNISKHLNGWRDPPSNTKKRCDIDHFHATGILGKKADYLLAVMTKQIHKYTITIAITKYINTEIQRNTQIHKYMQRQQIITSKMALVGG